MFRSELDKTFQVLDCSVNEDTVGIMARSVCGEDCIGACSEDQNIIGNGVASRCPDGLVVGENIGDFSVEVIIE